MKIGGLQKTSLVDFPAKLSAVVFTVGCNFHCPYCHNPELVNNSEHRENLSQQAVLDFLTKRQNVLSGVVISGGEATLQTDLLSFCQEIKSLGYAIKLDTNGSKPEILQALLNAKVLDYVAMDIKAEIGNYPQEICATSLNLSISQSLKILEKARQEQNFPYELRIPCAKPFIDATSIKWLKKLPQEVPIYFQEIRLEKVLNEAFFKSKEQILTKKQIEDLVNLGITQGYNWSAR